MRVYLLRSSELPSMVQIFGSLATLEKEIERLRNGATLLRYDYFDDTVLEICEGTTDIDGKPESNVGQWWSVFRVSRPNRCTTKGIYNEIEYSYERYYVMAYDVRP